MFAATLVFLLAASGGLCYESNQCITSMQQARVSRMRETANPLTWLQMADKCYVRDSSVLLQSHSHLSDAEKLLCDYQNLVPLGFFRDETGKIRFQSESFIVDPEPTIGSDLLGYHDSELDEVHYWEKGYAALDLTTGHWHLVKADTKFSCALCQAAPITSLADYSADAVCDYLDFNFYRVRLEPSRMEFRHSGKDRPTDAITEAVSHLPEFDEIVETNISRSSVEFLVRVYQGKEWDLESLQDFAILPDMVGYHWTMSVEFATICPAVGDEDADQAAFHCREGFLGEVCFLSVNETQGRFATRLCEVDSFARRPAWGKPITWQAAHRPCSALAQYASEVAFFSTIQSPMEIARAAQLQPYLGVRRVENSLDNVADVISRELRATNELTFELRGDLVRILTNTLLDWYAVSRPGAQLAVGLAGGFGMESYAKGLALAWVEPDNLLIDDIGMMEDEWSFPYVEPTLVTEYHHVTVPRPQVALALSPTLNKSTQKVAFFTLWPQPETWDKAWRFGDRTSSRFLEVSVVLVDMLSYITQDSDSFVDVTYRRQANSVSCATWDVRGKVWDYTQCSPLKSLSADNAACRCRTSNAAVHDYGKAMVVRIALRTPRDGDLGALIRSELLQAR